MTAALRRIEVDSKWGGILNRREPSPALRRKPSLYLASCNPNRLTTTTYDVQGRTSAAGGRKPGAADPEDRLTEDRLTAGSGTTNTLVYDPNGNRTQLNTTAYLYTANTNRLTKVGTKVVTLDPSGDTTQDNLSYNYTHDAAGRLKEARSGKTLKGTYTYNHQHQRTRKVAGTATTVYHYGLNGELLAETTNTGTLIRAYVHDDSAPIAQVTKTTTDTLVHLHPDQLGTPRIATDAARSTVWRYDGNAFGDTLPNEDPDGNRKKTTVNLRFPGQYYDAETKLFYNWHRYYDPRIGRYVTSDPIGLEGGMNTYAYVANGPLRYLDPYGLRVTFYERRIQATNSGGHVFLELSPDSPDEVKCLLDKAGLNPDIPFPLRLSGLNEPGPNGTTILGKGYNYPGDTPSTARFSANLNAPNYPNRGNTCCNKQDKCCNASNDSKFIVNLIKASLNYNSDLPYDPFVTNFGEFGYNSNSFISGILKASGFNPLNLPNPRFVQPGLYVPIPLQPVEP